MEVASGRHLVTEEESFFPLALRVLGPEHWAEIDAQVTDREDSLFGGAGEERFHALHEIILELERAGGKSPTRVRPSPPAAGATCWLGQPNAFGCCRPTPYF